MTYDERRQVWAVYETACELPPSERAAYVHATLADEALRVKTLELLATAEDPFDEPDVPAPTNPAWPLVGKSLGRFEIREPLGRGGMGEVYKAFDPELDRFVAVKCIASKLLGTASAVASFIREARSASGLNHPGIVTIYEVVRFGDTVAIVMELVEGAGLHTFTGSPQPLHRVAAWAQRIAEALAATHARGIIHRDIKPENLILRGDGYIKILDFGLAANYLATAALLPMGTLRYMAPEQSRPGELTPATDIFSLGVVLYELATGVHPFAGTDRDNSTLAVAQAAHFHDPKPPSTIVRSLPRAFDSLLLDMLAKDPAARPAAETVARRMAGLPRRAGRRRLALAGLAAAAALAGAAFLRFPTAPTRPIEIPGKLFTGSPGREGDPTFSPDGQSLVYAWDGGSGLLRDIYVKRIGDADPVRLTATDDDEKTPAWSPDGARIAFVRQGSDGGRIVIVPAAGGPERVVTTIAQAESDPRPRLTWLSPTELVIADTLPNTVVGIHLFRVDAATGERALLLAAGAEESAHEEFHPLLSHDGRWLAFARALANATELRVWPTQGGPSRLLATVSRIRGFAWTPAGAILFYTHSPSGIADLLQVTPSGGPPVRASLAFQKGALGLAVSPDGRRAAYVGRTRDSNLWLAPAGTGISAARRIVASSRADEDGVLSPDGARIAFSSDRSGTHEIWVAAADGSRARAVTALNGFSASPAWSPDGSSLAFDSNIDGATTIWSVPVAGGPARRLVADGWMPSWSRDGRWIYYCSTKDGWPQIWRVPSSGGSPQQVTPAGGLEAREAPDGRHLYYSKGELEGIWRIPIDHPNTAEEKVAPFDARAQFRCWDVGASGLYIGHRGPQARIDLLRFGASVPTPAAFLPTDLLPTGNCFAVDPSGRNILYTALEADRQEIYLADLP